ncbi:hypothetical protein [Cytobacillus gottheilii]|uniref:hypothetical protein n=1 Tax=Cytobacillus gottheilii TaxID=859144 RepID=UPI0024956D11|nr:hypothetical protein [Cytobacillus gottheilii]
MNRNASHILLALSFLLILSSTEKVHANEIDDASSDEKFFADIGYKTPDEAIKEFEQHFKQNLKLPLKIPPIAFTHYLGRFSDLDGDLNDSLDLTFTNVKIPENHYSLDIRHVNNKIILRDRGNQKTYTLKDGQKAVYIIERGSSIFVFEKGNWQYMLSIDKRITDIVTPEMLIDIANSIEY